MSERVSRVTVLELLRGDHEVLEMLEQAGIIQPGDLEPTEVEEVLVARTLLRDLDVNLAGVEVVLRLRAELQQTRDQVQRLIQVVQLAQRRGDNP